MNSTPDAGLVTEYASGPSLRPLFVCGDSFEVLRAMPDSFADMSMTSPPYWGKRDYDVSGAIGLEKDYSDYIANLMKVFGELYRVLKPSGSFWLNMGDSYLSKRLLGIPWRVALRMCDEQGWILRNSVVWNKVKGSPDNSSDRLRNVHEELFHFVKAKKYYYDASMARRAPQNPKVEGGAVISATGVTGVRYRRQIELSTALSDSQKSLAFGELNLVLDQVRKGELSDFRMIIRGQQRSTHSDSAHVSGRARELENKGFYFLKYHPDGAKIGDVWDIMPEDSQGRSLHFAPYPADLCRTPVLTTCPPGGMVLDPFCGTGTTMAVALENGRKSIGVDISQTYLQYASRRIGEYERDKGLTLTVMTLTG